MTDQERIKFLAEKVLELVQKNTDLSSEVYRLKSENIDLRWTLDPERGDPFGEKNRVPGGFKGQLTPTEDFDEPVKLSPQDHFPEDAGRGFDIKEWGN